MGLWGDILLHNPERLKSNVMLEMSFVEIADGLSFLTMNAEVVVQYGLFIKEQTNRRILPLPYSNGVIGYVPTDEQVFDGGYGPYISNFRAGFPSPFSPKLEENIRKGIVKLIEDE